jgi:hypothetical protein
MTGPKCQLRLAAASDDGLMVMVCGCGFVVSGRSDDACWAHLLVHWRYTKTPIIQVHEPT